MTNKIENENNSNSELLSIKPLLSVKDFTQLTGISPAGFYVMLANGTGPNIVKIGGRTRITRKSLNEWIANIEASQIANNNIQAVGG